MKLVLDKLSKVYHVIMEDDNSDNNTADNSNNTADNSLNNENQMNNNTISSASTSLNISSSGGISTLNNNSSTLTAHSSDSDITNKKIYSQQQVSSQKLANVGSGLYLFKLINLHYFKNLYFVNKNKMNFIYLTHSTLLL